MGMSITSTPVGAAEHEQVIRSFRIDLELWEQFETVARSQHRSRGAQLRHAVQEAVAAHHQQTRDAAA